ncbi:probable ubiquitin-conjugating enzyme E2 23 isoform X2 [Durio zibethinus]|uniref:E2 ubiquitin-conjugating enzyme n=1 Tax=Durio zibethinus TaxID=66656 RepID=A0A6P6ADV2_DURZI|nr:probable ubiquitin-conjugating enzyme E2 23 isoform X2 [Durio zibethinus]
MPFMRIFQNIFEKENLFIEIGKSNGSNETQNVGSLLAQKSKQEDKKKPFRLITNLPLDTASNLGSKLAFVFFNFSFLFFFFLSLLFFSFYNDDLWFKKQIPISLFLYSNNRRFSSDVVRSNTSGAIGIVSEVAGDSDSDGSITDDEDEDEEEDGEDESGDFDADSNANESGDGSKGDHDYKCGDLQADQIRVLWMDDTEPVQSIKNVTVVDRGFLHGDYVAAASDSTGQVGVVVDVNISVDLLAPDGSIIKDVSSRDLQRVRDFTVGDYVVLGPWLGRIDDVLDNVNVLFDDGSVCKVTRAEPLRLKPSTRNTLEDDSNFPYYPGQRVRASSSSVFKNSRWLSGLWKANRLEGTVTKVTAGSVFIYWIASAGYGPDSSTAPAEEQNPKNLKLLSCFTHANWQVGDWCLLPTSLLSIHLDKDLSKSQLHGSMINGGNCDKLDGECDSEEVTLEESNDNSESMDLDAMLTPGEDNAIIETKDNGVIETKALPESSSCSSSLSVSKETVHEHWPLHRKKIRKVVTRKDKKAKKKVDNFERALLIANSRTRVDVAWQDGTVERGVDATTLVPIETPGDHEFVAEQYVVEKASNDGDDGYEPRRVGVVKSVYAKERTACVKWLKPVCRAEDPREFDREEIVSVYELEGHPDYDYCYGDVVVRLPQASVPVQSASGKGSIEEPKLGDGSKEVKQGSKKCSGSNKAKGVSLNETSIDFTDLSWVGNITGLRNGDIEVTWADGMVSTVGPQAIYVVGRDDDESVAAGSEDLEPQNASSFISELEEGMENNSGRNAALSLPLAAFDFVTRLASGLFSGRRKNVDPIGLDSKGENEHQPKGRDSSYVSSSQKSNGLDNFSGESVHGKSEEHVEAKAQKHSLSVESLCNLRIEDSDSKTVDEDGACSFKRFDTAKDPLDHYFLGANGQNNTGRKWLKKVQQDWNILQNNLPDGIYVRVYEDQMDLLRAVIVGAYGTPYQDGLFFFDFHLPPEYPDVPPSAYYHSGGWRINPNLYEEGKVCLSLLNTWTGRGNEVWDPSSSSILQVLVSLQGLVLNAKPYFNEAGYDKQVGTAEGEKNSLAYNENTFLLNCKSMMYLMRKPPKDFEELVRDHFRRRGYYILKACDAYMKGYLIGSLTKDASFSDENNANSTSVGFKLMLGKIVPKLLLALNEVGADCQEFKHLQQS